MKYISDEDVANQLLTNGPKYLDYLKRRIQEIADGQPVWIKPKIIYDDPIHPDAGDIRPMTCFTDRVKVVKIISTNPVRQAHSSVSVGLTVLLDYQENYPLAVFDATAMSGIRTAAMAITASQFAGADFSDVSLIGTGQVGTYILQLLDQLAKSPTIKSYDKKDGESPVFESKLVITATNSREAFLTPDNCKADCVVSVGADTHFNHELTAEFLQSRQHIYVDCWDAKNIGDLHLFAKNSDDQYHNDLAQGNLFDLLHNGDADTFISVGSPLMDALTVEYLQL